VRSRSRPAGLALACVIIAQLAGSALAAQEARRSAWPLELTLSSGTLNLERLSDSPQINLEFHFAPGDIPAPVQRLTRRWSLLRGLFPVAGVMAAADGSLFTYAGGRIDYPLGSRLDFSPSIAAGLYYRGEGKILGGALEFKSGIELTCRLSGARRLGAALYHLSNGGLYHSNPGTESLLLIYRTSLR
jgi:hypothetical protein